MVSNAFLQACRAELQDTGHRIRQLDVESSGDILIVLVKPTSRGGGTYKLRVMSSLYEGWLDDSEGSFAATFATCVEEFIDTVGYHYADWPEFIRINEC